MSHGAGSRSDRGGRSTGGNGPTVGPHRRAAPSSLTSRPAKRPEPDSVGAERAPHSGLSSRLGHAARARLRRLRVANAANATGAGLVVHVGNSRHGACAWALTWALGHLGTGQAGRSRQRAVGLQAATNESRIEIAHHAQCVGRQCTTVAGIATIVVLICRSGDRSSRGANRLVGCQRARPGQA